MDFPSILRWPLPPGQRFLVLELGIREAIADLFPAIAPNIETLEHPILTSEWTAQREPVAGDKLKIGFLGHASLSKGFDQFVRIAQTSGPEIEFHAIGLGSNEAFAMDLDALARRPSPTSEPRHAYIEALRGIDAVCLPLPRGYDYVASGSVIDALAGLKPLFCLQNRSMAGIVAKYGPIGCMAETADELAASIAGYSMQDFLKQRSAWIPNLTKIRAARSPEALAGDYASLLDR